ncbi:hypothetical protein BDD12DRAFT_923855 [Trichophaea hybrida]|nr:hypothetical protein BDD12DRAFT_923855 [Trichophaea hybrida]
MSIQYKEPPQIPPKSPRRVSRMHAKLETALQPSGTRLYSLVPQIHPVTYNDHRTRGDTLPASRDITTQIERCVSNTSVIPTVGKPPTRSSSLIPPSPPYLSMLDTTATTSTISTPTILTSGRSTASHCFSRCRSRTHSSAASIKDSLSDSPNGETEDSNNARCPSTGHVEMADGLRPSFNVVMTKAHFRPGLVANPRGRIFASTEISPERNKLGFKHLSRSPSPNRLRPSARIERQGLSTNIDELVDFFATEPAPASSDNQEIPAAFAALADGKKYIGLKDVASRGLGWRHPERVLDSDLDHFTEAAAPPRFRKPVPRTLGDESPVHCQSSARLGLWSNLKNAFCFINRKPIPRRSPQTHLQHHAPQNANQARMRELVEAAQGSISNGPIAR